MRKNIEIKISSGRAALTRFQLCLLASAAIVLSATEPVLAVTTIWTGPSTGGVFNDDDNWNNASPGDNPDPDGPNDLGIFNSATNVDGTITFDADITHFRQFVQNNSGTISFDTGSHLWTITDPSPNTDNGYLLIGNQDFTGPFVRHIGGEILSDRVLLGTSEGSNATLELTGSSTHFHTTRGSGGYSIGLPADGATMLVHNGASMTADGQVLIGLTGSSNSKLTIDGVGSEMTAGNYLGVGHTPGDFSNATGSRAEITGGATATAAYVFMAITPGATDNTLLVSGAGSTLTLSGVDGNVGAETGIGRQGNNNLFQIDQGGAVDGTNVFVLGLEPTSTGNQLLVDNGSLAGAGIEINQGNVTVTNGSVDLSQLFEDGGGITAANGASSTFTFNSGTVGSFNADINNGSAFTVGDGAGSSATYFMKQDANDINGTHSFADGLTLSSNAVLSGSGDITGSVSGVSGAVVSAGDSPGVINVDGAWDNTDLEIDLEVDDLSALSAVGGRGFDLLDLVGPFTHGGSVDIDVSEFVAGSGFVQDLKIVGWTSEVGSTTSTTVSFVGGPALPFEFRSDGLYLTDVSVSIVPGPGDFDLDGDRDGRDFLLWQRGFDAIFDAADLADWEANFGAPNSLSAANAVPEPGTALLCLGLVAGSLVGRRR